MRDSSVACCSQMLPRLTISCWWEEAHEGQANNKFGRHATVSDVCHVTRGEPPAPPRFSSKQHRHHPRPCFHGLGNKAFIRLFLLLPLFLFAPHIVPGDYFSPAPFLDTRFTLRPVSDLPEPNRSALLGKGRPKASVKPAAPRETTPPPFAHTPNRSLRKRRIHLQQWPRSERICLVW